MAINIGNFVHSLGIMLYGMIGIFIVMLAIYFCIYILIRISKKKKKQA